MHTIQQLAGQIVCRVLGGRNLNHALSAVLQAVPDMASQQRGALQDLCYGTLRFYGKLQRILEKLLHKPVPDAQLRCLILVALYQLMYSKAAPHTVVDNAVRAVSTHNPAAAGLTNAVLRNFLRQRESVLSSVASSEEGRYAYPQWWIDRVKEQHGDHAEAILLAGNLHPPMTLRVNIKRITAIEYVALLTQHDMQARVIVPDAVLLARPVPVDRLPGFHDGMISVQDAGAQYAAHILDVRDGMRVLDACAAPGGKTAHLLEMHGCELIALDKDEQRLEKVRENLQRLQLEASVQCGDAALPEEWWDGRPFQRILADVPCSASGVVRRHPDIKWLRLPADIDGFAQQQLAILNALWRLLAVDGKLLYATCSIFAPENQRTIDGFLQQHDDARLDSEPVAALQAAPEFINGQLLPNDQHDGFYYALLHKHG